MWMVPYITMSLLMIIGFFLIVIILLQRGRGGGLAGALGGMGGQSAFGTKAGDMFTRITIVLATVWMLVAVGNIYALQYKGGLYQGGSEAVKEAGALEADDKKDGAATDDDSAKDLTDLLKKADEAASENKAGEMPVEPEKFDATKPGEKPVPEKTDDAATPEKTTEEPKTEPVKDEAAKPAEKSEPEKTEKPAEPSPKKEDTNGNGLLDEGEDANSNGLLD